MELYLHFTTCLGDVVLKKEQEPTHIYFYRTGISSKVLERKEIEHKGAVNEAGEGK
jgi:hypothetical protein